VILLSCRGKESDSQQTSHSPGAVKLTSTMSRAMLRSKGQRSQEREWYASVRHMRFQEAAYSTSEQVLKQQARMLPIANAKEADQDFVTRMFGKVFGQESLTEKEPMVSSGCAPRSDFF
jgi:hypothetical protein